jgi:hypothetical protein
MNGSVHVVSGGRADDAFINVDIYVNALMPAVQMLDDHTWNLQRSDARSEREENGRML